MALPSDFSTSNQIIHIFRKSSPRTVVLVSPTVLSNFFKVGSNQRTLVYQPMAVKPPIRIIFGVTILARHYSERSLCTIHFP